MPESAFFSGDYRRWTFARQLGVPFYARQIRVPHLDDALKNGEIKSVSLQVNGNPIRGWRSAKDRIVFSLPLFRGNYSIYLEIIYTDLEQTVYRKW